MSRRKIKALYATGEVLPFSKTGGLADVGGSLPKALKRKGVDCRIVTPLYGPVDKANGMVSIDKAKLNFITSIVVPVSWRQEYCGIFETEHDGVTYYFIDNEKYFNRTTLFGEYDNAERFAFFSRAVLEVLPHIGFRPDIIISNDWQTALVPIYQDIIYSKTDWYAGIETIFTIHNIAFQGEYGSDLLSDVFGLPDSKKGVLEYDGHINLMKGAIATAHSVVTVSERYVEEIAGNIWDGSNFDFGCGLTPFIKANYNKLKGILNGLGENISPSTDEMLYANYDTHTFPTGKAKNKSELQKRLGLEQREDVPLIGVVTRIDSKQKGCELIVDVLDRGLLDDIDAQFVLLGSAADGDEIGKSVENRFRYINSRYEGNGKMALYIGQSSELASKIYAGSDIFLMPSRYEPCGLAQLISIKYGSIPIVHETGGLVDSISDCGNGTGNGFTFKNYSCDDLQHSITRALTSYKDSANWQLLVKRAMEGNFSWNTKSAAKYVELFERLLA